MKNAINMAGLRFPRDLALRAKSAAALPLRFWREVGAPEARSFAERAGHGTHRLRNERRRD